MMNSVDLILMGIVLITFLIGLWRGFIREFSSIMAWTLAGIATFWDVPFLRTFMRSHIHSSLMADLAAGVCVFLIAFIIISLMGTICAGFVRGSLVSSIDRSLGSLLGAFKGIVILCGLNIMAECFMERTAMPEIVQKSFVVHFYLYQGSDLLFSLLPQSIKNYLIELRQNNASLQQDFSTKDATDVSQETQETNQKVIEMGTLRPKIETKEYTKQQFDQLNQLLNKETGKTENTKIEKTEKIEA